jgi:hypothetical protein
MTMATETLSRRFERRGLKLYHNGKGSPVAIVEPTGRACSGSSCPAAKLSDMCNLSRIKDAARWAAIRQYLNPSICAAGALPITPARAA